MPDTPAPPARLTEAEAALYGYLHTATAADGVAPDTARVIIDALEELATRRTDGEVYRGTIYGADDLAVELDAIGRRDAAARILDRELVDLDRIIAGPVPVDRARTLDHLTASLEALERLAPILSVDEPAEDPELGALRTVAANARELVEHVRDDIAHGEYFDGRLGGIPPRLERLAFLLDQAERAA